jgi:hypothetical protein
MLHPHRNLVFSEVMKVSVTMRRRFIRRNLQDHFKARPGKPTEA